MKTSKRNKLLGLALVSSCSLLSANNALAAAGEDIANRATISYSVGNQPQADIGSSPTGNSSGAGADTVFREDRVINFTVVRENGAAVPVSPGSSQQAIPYLIDNTGNATHGFLLAGIHNSGALDPFGGAADNFTPTAIQTYVDTDGNGVLDPAEIAATNSYIPSFEPGVGSATGGLSTGAEIRVFVVSDIPLDEAGTPLATDDIAVMSLVAHAANDGTDGSSGTAIITDDNGNFTTGGSFTNGTADVANASGSAATNADNPATMETVFNDGAFDDGATGATVDGTGLAADIVQNAQHSSYSSYIVQSANLTITKTSQVIYDPINLDSFTDIATPNTNNPKALPFAYIQYTITIENAATAGASADLTTLTDVITPTGSANVNLDVNLLDSGKALGATLNFPGDEESPLGNIRIDTTLTGRTIPAAGFTYCTSAADADGCGYTSNPNGSVSVDFTNVPGMPVEGGSYTAGELKPGETVEIVFNVIVQ